MTKTTARGGPEKTNPQGESKKGKRKTRKNQKLKPTKVAPRPQTIFPTTLAMQRSNRLEVLIATRPKKKKRTHRGNKKRGKKRRKNINATLPKRVAHTIETAAARCTHKESVIEVASTPNKVQTYNIYPHSSTPSHQNNPTQTTPPTIKNQKRTRTIKPKRWNEPIPTLVPTSTLNWNPASPEWESKIPNLAEKQTWTTTCEGHGNRETEAAWTNLIRSRKIIKKEQMLVEEILAQNWEHKRLNWVSQCNIAIAKIRKDIALMERPDSDLFFPRFLEIESLPQKEQHWIWVLVGSGKVEKVVSPSWANITGFNSHDSNTVPVGVQQPNVPIGTALMFRFGFHLETIMDAIIVGLQNTISSTMTCLCIAEYVGLSRFSCYVHTHFSHSEHPWWIQEGTIQIIHLWDPKIQYQEITQTDWLSDDETAASWNWPQQNAILVDNQSPLRSCKGMPRD